MIRFIQAWTGTVVTLLSVSAVAGYPDLDSAIVCKPVGPSPEFETLAIFPEASGKFTVDYIEYGDLAEDTHECLDITEERTVDGDGPQLTVICHLEDDKTLAKLVITAKSGEGNSSLYVEVKLKPEDSTDDDEEILMTKNQKATCTFPGQN